MNEWISNLGQDSALLSGSVFSQGRHQGLYWWSESNTECWGGLWSLGGTRTAITRLVPWLAAGMIPFSLYCQPSPKWAAWEKTKGPAPKEGTGAPQRPLELPRLRLRSWQRWRRPGPGPVCPSRSQNRPKPHTGGHIPLTKSSRPTSQNKAEKELRHWRPINSHPKPPAFLGFGRFLHLCARGWSPPDPSPAHSSVGALAPPLAQFCPIVGWQGESGQRSANMRRALQEMGPEEGT